MHWGQNVCRICGELDETCHLIFTKDPRNDLQEKIKKLLKLEVFTDDCKPKQACTSCSAKLDDFYIFYNICHSTNQKFDAILLSRDSETQWGDEILDYTQHKMSVIVANKSLEHLECNEIDLYKEAVLPLDNCSINEHDMLEIVKNANYTNLGENLEYLNTNYGIKKFQNDFYQESTVLRHSSNYHQTPPESCSSNNYSCQGQSFSDLNYSNVGLDYTNYNSRQEPSNETFTSFQATQENNSNSDTGNNKIENQAEHTNTLTKTVTSNRKMFACPHCDKKFKRRVTLNSHIAIHTKLRPYVCEICKKSYAIKCDLTNHQKIHTDKNKCEYCSSTFPAPSKLLRHMRTHTKDKPFVCDFKNCSKSFSDKRNLDGHKLIHSDVFNFHCKDCGKPFRSKNRLTQHMKSHVVSASYICDICSKAYKYKCTLIFHLKKHNGYFCSFCDKDCEKPVKLIKHKKECLKKLIS